MKIDKLIDELNEMKEKYGNAEVQIFSWTTEDDPDDHDNVVAHDIQYVSDGWYYDHRGDVINVEIDRTRQAVNVHTGEVPSSRVD